jgi:hypothetical protein
MHWSDLNNVTYPEYRMDWQFVPTKGHYYSCVNFLIRMDEPLPGTDPRHDTVDQVMWI